MAAMAMILGAEVTGIAAKAQEGHYPIDPRLQVGHPTVEATGWFSTEHGKPFKVFALW